MREMASTEIASIAQPDGVHYRDVRRNAFGKKASFEGRQQHLRHGMSSA